MDAYLDLGPNGSCSTPTKKRRLLWQAAQKVLLVAATTTTVVVVALPNVFFHFLLSFSVGCAY